MDGSVRETPSEGVGGEGAGRVARMAQAFEERMGAEADAIGAEAPTTAETDSNDTEGTEGTEGSEVSESSSDSDSEDDTSVHISAWFDQHSVLEFDLDATDKVQEAVSRAYSEYGDLRGTASDLVPYLRIQRVQACQGESTPRNAERERERESLGGGLACISSIVAGPPVDSDRDGERGREREREKRNNEGEGEREREIQKDTETERKDLPRLTQRIRDMKLMQFLQEASNKVTVCLLCWSHGVHNISDFYASVDTPAPEEPGLFFSRAWLRDTLTLFRGLLSSGTVVDCTPNISDCTPNTSGTRVDSPSEQHMDQFVESRLHSIIGPFTAKVEEYSRSQPQCLRRLRRYIRRLCWASVSVYGRSGNTPPTPREIQVAREWEMKHLHIVMDMVLKRDRKRTKRKKRGKTDDGRTYEDDVVDFFSWAKIHPDSLEDVHFFMNLPGITLRLTQCIYIMKDMEKEEMLRRRAERNGHI
ncbi:hypothetical protein KIPB_003242 [Kipferlia bialata]|uniref:Uncharacterized protein n=1 Tax=Kipferlia bialata TaxID=797122 RepID=A0A9K3CS63_9EUKA|nr:hypothetical protein KIPB_003242 [Kipferlia bialata]|eukprot:g3242.t1